MALGDSARRELAAQPTANLAAYDAFLKGEAASQSIGRQRSAPASGERVGFYEQAVALDSTFVAAWAQLARARASLYGNGAPTPQLAPGAPAAAERARGARPRSARGLPGAGRLLRNVPRDNRRALRGVRGGAQAGAQQRRPARRGGARPSSAWAAGRRRCAHLAAAAELDPRSASTARRLALCCSVCAATPRRRRRSIGPRARARPTSQSSSSKVDGGARRRATSPAPRRSCGRPSTTVEPAALVAFFGNYWRPLLGARRRPAAAAPAPSRPAPSTTTGRPGASSSRETYAARGDQARARAYADSARLALRGAAPGARRTTRSGTVF